MAAFFTENGAVLIWLDRRIWLCRPDVSGLLHRCRDAVPPGCAAVIGKAAIWAPFCLPICAAVPAHCGLPGAADLVPRRHPFYDKACCDKGMLRQVHAATRWMVWC